MKANQRARRNFLCGISAAGMGILITDRASSQGVVDEPGGSIPAHFPAQDPSLVQKVVGLSHHSLQGVRELVDARPALAKAAWDWGFGDWETALGAASHTGQRDIALYLIEKGARPDVFTFAMLGNLNAVRAMIEGSAGLERLPGPHGIPLLVHAEMGGEPAEPVADYLRSIGGADQGSASQPLTDEERLTFAGVYVFGEGNDDQIEIKPGKKLVPLTLERRGGSPRNLFYVGDNTFYPVGAPAVSIRFVVESGRASTIEVRDAELFLTAKRAGAS